MNQEIIEQAEIFQLPVGKANVLALGGELKNTFCLTRGTEAFVSPPAGDLKDFDAYARYQERIRAFQEAFGITPGRIAHDMHPDYLSTRYAQETFQDIPKIAVQHHKAHVAACMAENVETEDVIGVAFDGTGYGEDGEVWGGEFFAGNFRGFERMAHFRYTAMPGADKAALEPWRMAAAYVYQSEGDGVREYTQRFKDGDFIITMLKKNVNCPRTSSAGRLFDAVSSLAGLCDVHEYEADAAIRLENMCAGNCDADPYPYRVENGKIDVSPMMQEIITAQETPEMIARRFHQTVAQIILAVCVMIRDQKGISKAALCGGVFLNKVLSSRAEELLTDNGFKVLTHRRLSPGDSSISLGQAAIVQEVL